MDRIWWTGVAFWTLSALNSNEWHAQSNQGISESSSFQEKCYSILDFPLDQRCSLPYRATLEPMCQGWKCLEPGSVNKIAERQMEKHSIQWGREPTTSQKQEVPRAEKDASGFIRGGCGFHSCFREIRELEFRHKQHCRSGCARGRRRAQGTWQTWLSIWALLLRGQLWANPQPLWKHLLLGLLWELNGIVHPQSLVCAQHAGSLSPPTRIAL